MTGGTGTHSLSILHCFCWTTYPLCHLALFMCVKLLFFVKKLQGMSRQSFTKFRHLVVLNKARCRILRKCYGTNLMAGSLSAISAGSIEGIAGALSLTSTTWILTVVVAVSWGLPLSVAKRISLQSQTCYKVHTFIFFKLTIHSEKPLAQLLYLAVYIWFKYLNVHIANHCKAPRGMVK